MARFLLRKSASQMLKEAADAKTIAYANRMRARNNNPAVRQGVSIRGANGHTRVLKTPAEFKAYGIPENPTPRDIEAAQSARRARNARVSSSAARKKEFNRQRFGSTRRATAVVDMLPPGHIYTPEHINRVLRKGRYRRVTREFYGYNSPGGPLAYAKKHPPQTVTERYNDTPKGYKAPTVYSRGNSGDLNAVSPVTGKTTPSTAASVGVQGGKGLRFRHPSSNSAITVMPGRSVPNVNTGRYSIPQDRFRRYYRNTLGLQETPEEKKQRMARVNAGFDRIEQEHPLPSSPGPYANLPQLLQSLFSYFMQQRA